MSYGRPAPPLLLENQFYVKERERERSDSELRSASKMSTGTTAFSSLYDAAPSRPYNIETHWLARRTSKMTTATVLHYYYTYSIDSLHTSIALLSVYCSLLPFLFCSAFFSSAPSSSSSWYTACIYKYIDWFISTLIYTYYIIYIKMCTLQIRQKSMTREAPPPVLFLGSRWCLRCCSIFSANLQPSLSLSLLYWWVFFSFVSFA